MSTAEDIKDLEAQNKQDGARLISGRFKLAEFVRDIYCVTVEPDIKFETVLKPDFWSHVEPKLKPYDRIEVRTDDGRYYAELLVLSKITGAVKVHVLNKADLHEEELVGKSVTTANYQVKWKGPHMKFCIVRVADGKVVEEELDNKDQALKRAAKLEAEYK